MYRLTIFVLLSCVSSQRLARAVREEESPFSRTNLFFDSYDRPSLEEFEESEADLRDAVLMQPEQVLDVPPVPVEQNYGTEDFDFDEPAPKDRTYQSVWSSQANRGFFQDLLEEIQTIFSKWPPILPSESPTTPEYRYQFDDSLLEDQKTELRVLLAIVEEKTCMNIVEEEESPQIIFMGVPGCSIAAVENKIVIGYQCFEPTMILKLMLKLFAFCSVEPLERAFKANKPLYIDSYRNKMQRATEEDIDCKDKFGFCLFLAKGNNSLPCSSCSHAEKFMCSRTCRLCGDSCVDYDSDCNTDDVLKDCLSDWDQKKIGCANTCGVCKNDKESRVCADFYPCCVYYAKRGFCKKLPKIFKKYCAHSCGYCKPKSCVDLRTDCLELKMLGGCQKMPDLMGKNCARTCDLCGNGVENRGNDKRRAPKNCNFDDDFVNKHCSWNPFITD